MTKSDFPQTVLFLPFYHHKWLWCDSYTDSTPVSEILKSLNPLVCDGFFLPSLSASFTNISKLYTYIYIYICGL